MGVFSVFSAGKIFSGFPGFSAPAERGTRTAAGGFALTGRLLFCIGKPGCANCVSVFALSGRLLFCTGKPGHANCVSVFASNGRLLFCTDCARHSNCRRRVRPDGAASFLHRKAGARELPQAGSPLTGGKFSAESQRGDSPSADGGNVPRPAAGAKRKDNLRFSFLFELLPFPCFLIWRRFPICDRCEIRGTAVGLPQRVFLRLFAVHRQRTATHTVYSAQGAT